MDRKTGVRVAGDVRVDEDGLENVEEFYKQTSPPNANDENQNGGKALRTRTLHTLLSPTPIRSTANYDTLMGALDMPSSQARKTEVQTNATTLTSLTATDVMEEDEATVSPIQARAMRAHQFNTDFDSRAGANRRTTLAPARQRSREAEWMRSPRKGRRVTMAFMGQKSQNGNIVESTAEFAEEASTSARDAGYDDDLSPDIGTIDAVKDGFVPGEEGQVDNDMEDDVPGNVIDDAQEDYFDDAVEHRDLEEQVGEQETEDIVYSEDSELDEPNQQQPDEQPIDDDASASESHGETVLDDHGREQEDAENEATNTKSDEPNGSKKSTKSKRGLDSEHPVRRSTRATIQPVAYWRNEHVEYEYKSGPNEGAPVPKMKGVVRVRQTAEEKNQAKKRRVKRNAQNLPSLRGIKRSELDPDDRNQFFYYDDEGYGFPVSGDNSGKYGPKFVSQNRNSKAQNAQKRTIDIFDDDDDIPVDERPKPVLLPDGESEVDQEVVISRQSIEWSNVDTKSDKYKVGLGLFMEEEDGRVDASTGVLSIAVGGRKPPRNSSNKLLFYLVTAGKVEVSMHASKFKVGVLGQFMIPKYNTYSIENVGTHPAQLYYVNVCPPEPVASASIAQGQGDVVDEGEDTEEIEDEDE
ncbi:mitotic fidelity of chromosome transmission- protein [Coemansia sp. RSA 1813]|nr:mitotic fidelity of chromosome transmission- protein [Coemansia sp. RSA 1843]KAJ2091429.1 mitotic fidelity of chromosome transmission- protein [Coemansia sp. RSA 986]KAJ2213906.1 mitotic fidelity of chromosome transmission- protein [Coemansia sp. RSA 487]KAJ2569594.1 mitotic fidelity of chromosome transmission- protein [Coemansia sp. RSA 1813]